MIVTVAFGIISLLNLVVALLYGGHTAVLVSRAAPAIRRLGRRAVDGADPSPEIPVSAAFVTVQVPLFNEGEVARGVIESVARLEWPADRLEVHVLDDSTDPHDRALVDDAAREARGRGVDVQVIRRELRHGFKAGAMSDALPAARGEFIAVFDADFRPNPDFLRRLMSRFTDDRIGMVQGRWAHLNAGENLLTRCQELMIDAHFAVEQVARNHAGWFVNFNGTGGIWRRACIENAGGWRSATLTEDLDLSYRARLNGWKLVYDVTTPVPAELPATMNAFKVQQRRWNRGTIQVMREQIGRVLSCRSEPLLARLDASLFLLRPLLHLWLVTILVLSLPMAVAGVPISLLFGVPIDAVGFVDLMWVSGVVSMFLGLLSGAVILAKDWRRALVLVPVTMALGVGICLSNAWAVFEGLRGRPGGFVRTPKGRHGQADTVAEFVAAPARTLRQRTFGLGGQLRRLFVSPTLALLELAAAVYLVLSFPVALGLSDHAFSASFILLFAAGLVWVVGSEIKRSGGLATPHVQLS